jgi:hypothetical protein
MEQCKFISRGKVGNENYGIKIVEQSEFLLTEYEKNYQRYSILEISGKFYIIHEFAGALTPGYGLGDCWLEDEESWLEGDVGFCYEVKQKIISKTVWEKV